MMTRGTPHNAIMANDDEATAGAAGAAKVAGTAPSVAADAALAWVEGTEPAVPAASTVELPTIAASDSTDTPA
ncbi:hypothetical protein Taro_020834 [Colocasia esculenta]|uniref:Uncharacterized protein n=1 Tax=Colocasia esculenta TaxID=4460 RepID=A0A843UZT4_COLES|nr:hypothetical protein [Colocasia esculenta]